MTQKKSYEKKLEAQLDEWDAEIDKLKAIARKAEADAEVEYSKKYEELIAKKAAADEKLAELKDASDDAWEDLKIGVDSAWRSLGQAINSASSRFQ